ncbi:MAG TPA: N-acetyltransferase [Clostridiales bacterium]|nr:N-acetyltransferase [Clostridiales bacterium]
MIIRRAKIDDAYEAAELICMAWQESAYVLAGSSNKSEVMGVIENFFKQPKNSLSYQYIDVAEGKNGIAGLILSFPWDFTPRLNKPIIEELPDIYRSSQLDFKEKVIPMIKTKEAKPDEYYVDSVAVYPKYRGHGIADGLLKVAKIKSATYGFDKMSLIVKPENKRAISLYKKHGYTVRGKLTLGDKIYLSMVKSIDSEKALA